MKDALGHGSNARGTARQERVAMNRAVDARHYPAVDRAQVMDAASPLLHQQPGVGTQTALMRLKASTPVAAHALGIHRATKGRTL